MTRLRFVIPVLALAALSAAGVSARVEAAASAAAPAVLAAPRAASPRRVLPFLHDDWSRAMELARQRRLPVFVDAWAPW